MMKELLMSIRLLVVMTVVLGLGYPVAMTCFAQVAFADTANGSLVYQNDKMVGSKLIGQNFSQDRYFHGRPSNAGADGYDAVSSGGSNLGPTNAKQLALIAERAAAVRANNQLAPNEKVASDLVTASGSGLDPHISPAAAALQVERVAKARSMEVAVVKELVDTYTEQPQLGFLGDARVNVLLLNVALDSK